MTVRWTFYDPTGPTTYNFPINPNEGGSPELRKTISYQNTSAPDGKVLVFEGRDSPPTMSFSGTLLTEAQYEAFETWFQKRRQIKITDDLDREYWIYITSYAPKRVRARNYPWKHTYQIEATIIDWP